MAQLLEACFNEMVTINLLFTVASICFFSLAVKSTGIAECAYETLWCEADISYRTSIYFIIMRSQKACSLTSLNDACITLSTFGQILSSTWSYISLANTLYDNRD